MERETDQEVRDRQDKEKAEANEARRARQGGLETLVEEQSTPAPKAAKPAPKPKNRAKPKSTAKK